MKPSQSFQFASLFIKNLKEGFLQSKLIKIPSFQPKLIKTYKKESKIEKYYKNIKNLIKIPKKLTINYYLRYFNDYKVINDLENSIPDYIHNSVFAKELKWFGKIKNYRVSDFEIIMKNNKKIVKFDIEFKLNKNNFLGVCEFYKDNDNYILESFEYQII